MTDLSQAAKAVRDAYKGKDTYNFPLDGVAAALRVVADRVVPDQQEPISSPHMCNFISHVQWRQFQAIRTQLLAIADELESQ